MKHIALFPFAFVLLLVLTAAPASAQSVGAGAGIVKLENGASARAVRRHRRGRALPEPHGRHRGPHADSDDMQVAIHLLAVDFRVSDTLNFFGAVRRDEFGDDSEARHQTKFYGGPRFKF